MNPKVPILLLPGMDGTGDLFEPLVSRCPVDFEPVVVRYSRDHAQTSDELVSVVTDLLPAKPCVILAESFSGTVAIKVAARNSSHVKALVLCNAFVKPPAPTVLRFLAWSWLMQHSPPTWFLRKYLLGPDASATLIGTVRAAIRSVSPSVLAARLRGVLSEDAQTYFRELTVPVLDLRGTNDSLVSHRGVSQLRSLRPDIHVANISGPHLLLQVAPETAWSAIQQFLLAV